MLSNAVDKEDYVRAEEEVRKKMMGLDHDAKRHRGRP